jgi:hypothetical protein
MTTSEQPQQPLFNVTYNPTETKCKLFLYEVKGEFHTMRIIAPDRLKAIDIFKNLTNFDHIDEITNIDLRSTTKNHNSKQHPNPDLKHIYMNHHKTQPVIQTVEHLATSLFTLSKMFVNGEFICYILEDPIRPAKIKHKTAIDPGYYPLQLLKFGRIHENYSKRFPKDHKGVFFLQNVKNFTGIAIHIGNTTNDTSGCLLAGSTYELLSNGDCILKNSTAAYFALYNLLIELHFHHKALFLFHRCKIDYPFSD